jgi:small-conductance mechanosensitive channel
MPVDLFPHDINWPNVGARAAGVILTWLAVWYLVRHLGHWLDRFYAGVRGQSADRRELRSLDALLNALLVTAGVVITLAILELTPLLMSLLTAAGFVGIITGFAVKDVAANLVSGIFLLIDHPFAVGDFVAAGNVQGTVERISLRSTRIRTLDGPVVTVPNSIIAASAITNYTVNPFRRFELTLTLPLNVGSATELTEVLDRGIHLLLELAAAEPRLAADARPQVVVGDVHGPSVDLQLICQAPNAIWSQVQSDMKQALLVKAKEQGLPEALPAQLVYTAPLTAKGGGGD